MKTVYRLLKYVFYPDQGQSLILFALLTPALMLTMLLALEGGRTFVEYKKLQSTADMAALVGAQDLPCGTTAATCVNTAESDACQAAANNGYMGCAAVHNTAGSQVTSPPNPLAAVPPLSCSPYDLVPYGNSTNANCKSQPTPTAYSYIEVQLEKKVTVPWLPSALNFTMYAHAVARHGAGSPSSYALTELDPSTPLSFGGSNQTTIEGSVFANGGVQGNGLSTETCDGGWYGAGQVSNVSTDQTGTAQYVGPACTGGTLSTTVNPVQPQISDPYGSSSPPPTLASTNPVSFAPGNADNFANCPECTQWGLWTPDGHTWYQEGGTPTDPSVTVKDVSGTKGPVELFPGLYTGFPQGDVIFNPGVYTFQSAWANHGEWCVYGAPACDQSGFNGNSTAGSPCYPSTGYTTPSQAGDQYYYACSPYGYWDNSEHTFNGFATRPASLPTSAPTWWNTNGTVSSTPLNGVTIYMPGTSSVTIHGNAGKDGGIALAAPNPCPGTGTSYTTDGSPAVSFPAGATSGVYSNASSPLPSWMDLPESGSPAGADYPSMDFSVEAECQQERTLNVWPGEMPTPQHLHFVFYMPNTTFDVSGADDMKLFGIVYDPKGTFTLRGDFGNANHPGGLGGPWITGQLVTGDMTASGNTWITITYRPCRPGPDGCSSGAGTQLIQ